MADFDVDGKEDLAIASYGNPSNFEDGDVTRRRGAGNGTFPTQFANSPLTFPNSGIDDVNKNPSSVAVGDFNGDAIPDLAVTNENSLNDYDVMTSLGNGDGTFGGTPTYYAGTHPTSVAIGDVNEDAKDDLAVAAGFANCDSMFCYDPGGVRIRLGSGSGTFPTEVTGPNDSGWLGVSQYPRTVAIGDFNADGHEDFALANTENDSVTVRLGAGDGSFAAQAPGSPYGAGDAPLGLGVGDFNSDGRDDLAVGSANSQDVTVRLAGADGSLSTQAAGSPYSAVNPAAVALGDFDSDGNTDIAAANESSGDVTVRLGGGPSLKTGNLLENPGAEWPGAARTSSQSPSIPGWTAGELSGLPVPMTYVRYSAPGFMSHIDAPRVEGSLGFFAGGPARAFGDVRQTADVSDEAAAIDNGQATAHLSADLGGYANDQDTAVVDMLFMDAASNSLGGTLIGPVTAAERHNHTTLLRRADSKPVPPGTRKIFVRISASRNTGTYNDAYADNLKLTLSLQPPALSPSQAAATVGQPAGTNVKGSSKKCKKKAARKKKRCRKK